MAGRIGNIFLKGAVAAYSLRRLRSTYTGAAIRIRRDSDNAEIDIGFTQNGELDTASISNFAPGASNVFVTTWYDQSGNDVHQARTIANQQPQIVSGGTLYMDNGKPALYFNGNMSMRSIIDINLTSPLGEWSSFAVTRFLDPLTSLGARIILSSDSPVRIGQFLLTGTINRRFRTVAFRSDGSFAADLGLNSNTNQNILNTIRTTSTVEIFVNGITDGSASITGTPATGITPLDVGWVNGINFAPNSQPFGYIQEIIHYPLDTTNTYRSILNTINSYYRVY